MVEKSVSDMIPDDEILTWKDDDCITISAGTGKGKSYFAKNKLYEIAKTNNRKILFLVHRNNCLTQFENEVKQENKQDIIDIKTYQLIEHREVNDCNINLSEYDYIVCDEFHYFLDDIWNDCKDMSLEKILKCQSVKIFMSATGDNMLDYLNNYRNIKTKDYDCGISYDFIESLNFYFKDIQLETIIKNIVKDNIKGILFSNDLGKALELYNIYREYSIFNCSKSNTKYYKYVNEKKINEMLDREKFSENLLITSSAMDSGVTIKDEQVKVIIADIRDTNCLIQCIGRKRQLNQDDKIVLYINSISNQKLGGLRTATHNRIESGRYLLENGVNAYIQKYGRSRDNKLKEIVYNDLDDDGNPTVKLNDLVYRKNISYLKEIDYILSLTDENGEKDKYAYCKYISKKLNKQEYKYTEYQEEAKNIKEYLDNLTNEELDKESQRDLVNMVGLKDRKGRLLKSIGIIDAYLAENYNKEIKSIRKTKDKRKHAFWIIENIKKPGIS